MKSIQKLGIIIVITFLISMINFPGNTVHQGSAEQVAPDLGDLDFVSVDATKNHYNNYHLQNAYDDLYFDGSMVLFDSTGSVKITFELDGVYIIDHIRICLDRVNYLANKEFMIEASLTDQEDDFFLVKNQQVYSNGDTLQILDFEPTSGSPFDLSPFSAKYLRVVFIPQSGYWPGHIYEVSAWGELNPAYLITTIEAENVYSSWYSDLAHLNDGAYFEEPKRMVLFETTSPAVITFTLNSIQEINRIQIAVDRNKANWEFKIEGSLNKVDWFPVKNKASYGWVELEKQLIIFETGVGYDLTPFSARFVRIEVHQWSSVYWPGHIYEVDFNEGIPERSYDLLDNELPVPYCGSSNDIRTDPISVPIINGMVSNARLVTTVRINDGTGPENVLKLWHGTSSSVYGPTTDYVDEEKTIVEYTLGDLSEGIHYFEFALNYPESILEVTITDVVLIYNVEIPNDNIDMRIVEVQGFKHDKGVLHNWGTEHYNPDLSEKHWDRVSLIAEGISFNVLWKWLNERGFYRDYPPFFSSYQNAARDPWNQAPESNDWDQMGTNGGIFQETVNPCDLKLGKPTDYNWENRDTYLGDDMITRTGFRLYTHKDILPNEWDWYQLRLWNLHPADDKDAPDYVVGTCHVDHEWGDDHSGWTWHSLRALYKYFEGWVGENGFSGYKLISCEKVPILQPYDYLYNTDGDFKDKYDHPGYAVVLSFQPG